MLRTNVIQTVVPQPAAYSAVAASVPTPTRPELGACESGRGSEAREGGEIRAPLRKRTQESCKGHLATQMRLIGQLTTTQSNRAKRPGRAAEVVREGAISLGAIGSHMGVGGYPGGLPGVRRRVREEHLWRTRRGS